MPDEARELQTIRPASHTTALGELFIADVWGRTQAKVSAVEFYLLGSRGGDLALGALPESGVSINNVSLFVCLSARV
jgi:hypothetical protein